MFISLAQIEISLARLASVHPFFGTAFLAFKQYGLPIGKTTTAHQSPICEGILKEYFRPSQEYLGFYAPFETSKREGEGWKTLKYPSGGLQRICTDTFGDAFLHPKKSSEWGWKRDYISALGKHLQNTKLPAFDLAAWLFRDQRWPKGVSRRDVREQFFQEFRINSKEKQVLFDSKLPTSPRKWLQPKPIAEAELLELIGLPPGAKPPGGALLQRLEIHYVGPTKHFTYEPGDRLNIITGDNSLGKTFLLELIWWALSENWLDYPAFPRPDATKRQPRIKFEVSTGARRTKELTATFDWAAHVWKVSPKREAVAGLVIYSRYDGSFAVWDPARARLAQEGSPESDGQVVMKQRAVWDGVRLQDPSGRERTICNGLVSDWVTWQVGGKRYQEQYNALVASLAALSPSPDQPLAPGDPFRFPLQSQECPTLRMPYGDVPVLLASAGIQRVVALAYVLVWAWHEHLMNARTARAEPQRRLVLLVDEVEAHLHPKWQRRIVPALMDVVAQLSKEVTPQIHVATHSPLVLASAEAIFEQSCDELHHMFLDGDNVILETVDFIKHGRADRWLMSDIFGLRHARSVPAELAIEDAKGLQLSKRPDTSAVQEVHRNLVEHLADNDDFWPRWIFFAQQHGVTT